VAEIVDGVVDGERAAAGGLDLAKVQQRVAGVDRHGACRIDDAAGPVDQGQLAVAGADRSISSDRIGWSAAVYSGMSTSQASSVVGSRLKPHAILQLT
jgi:hypothetical protein